ncbi:response regulator transcription factor [Sulfitobacter sp. F26204]|uniref:response regulator n=1 Tax=Sulfitobacter sp. F26204 TaxID=2996014 RepID=UPI00225E3DDE|nr:response regulator transcription factor [Sulfitobacter sp. F26204]MCX7561318.1 response regulator transcription factor [Sulfitobacter sp. F26204]
MSDHSTKQFRAVIADDHQIVRDGLRVALETAGVVGIRPIRVVTEAQNGLEAIEIVKRETPDLLLLDISMPLASGAEILADIKRWSPDTRIVVLTAVTSVGLLSSIVQSGVDGLFSKASDNAELFAKLPVILAGGRHIETSLVALLRDTEPLGQLTLRERQSLNMIVAGRTNAEIAARMGVSPKTAEKHRSSLMQKLGVKSVVELMSKALREGLIEEQGHLE